MRQKVLLTMKLPQLQNLMKRDPSAYLEEFSMQRRHFESELELFKLRPMKDSDRFTELVNFMAHVCPCYKEDESVRMIPEKLIYLMDNQCQALHPDVRAKLLTSLILLRNREMVEPEVMLRLAFKLFSVNDKALRTSLFDYILNDIKSINSTKRNDKLNRRIQAVLFGVVTEDTSIAAKKSIHILCDLYRRRVWTDSRTVNVIAAACNSQATSVMITAIHFFLGIESKMMEDEDEEEGKKNSQEVNMHEHSKKTKKRLRSVTKQQDKNAKLLKKEDDRKNTPLFPAIQLINDPQLLIENMFKRLRHSGDGFETKVLCINFISRIIGCHKLLLLSFYR